LKKRGGKRKMLGETKGHKKKSGIGKKERRGHHKEKKEQKRDK